MGRRRTLTRTPLPGGQVDHPRDLGGDRGGVVAAGEDAGQARR
jgi:hypothetical protein